MGCAPARIGLSQQADAHDRLARSRALAMQRDPYIWAHTPGLPPYCKEVPPAERFSAHQRDRMVFDVVQSIADAALGSLKWRRRRPGDVGAYSLFYPLRQVPDVAGRWMLDEEFGRQRLDGNNPFMITAVDEVPEKFPVTDEVLRGVLPDGVTMGSLLAQGRIFTVDFAALHDVPVDIGCFITAPIAMFWLDDRDRLMPLAIQLGQSPGEAGTIFTPADPKWLWMTARTFLQQADGNHHELVAHLARTHLVMEPVWVAACRTLPPQHPVHELLRPHFTGTIAINHEARTRMLAPGGSIDVAMAIGSEGSFWLIAQEYERWSFTDWHPRRDLDRRGVRSTSRLPGYHYRDDALVLFDAISDYVSDLLGVFYRSDDDVRDDRELQAWVAEMEAENGGRVRGLPTEEGRLVSFTSLCELVELVLYLASCEHAAVNNGQYDLFGFVPNAPGSMFLPPPKDKRYIDEAEFTYYLPMPAGVECQIKLMSLLSEPTILPIGHYEDGFFQSSPEARLAIDRFQLAMSDIEIGIDRRNSALAVPYTYLSPPTVGRSIAV